MKMIFAPDSFKGSLTAVQAANILREQALRLFPAATCVCVPAADGGEGTIDALLSVSGGERRFETVEGPMGMPVRAEYGMLPDGTAVIEMAQASGLPLVSPEARNPLAASSCGTGELIVKALNGGARRLLIGIGGSATNDGGMGMLRAMGARFLDAGGTALRGCGADLERVVQAELSGLHPALSQAEITVICDVSNPLLGERGATAIYGPQKGATPAMLERLEAGMRNYAQVMAATLKRPFAEFSGAGAAGGMGAALGGVLGAVMKPGIEAVLDAANFDALLGDCSLVITGEGRIDRQSVAFGKVPAGVAKRCARYNVPVIALVGGIGEGAQALYDVAESSIMSIIPAPMDLEQAMQNAPMLFADAAERMFRMLRIGGMLK